VETELRGKPVGLCLFQGFGLGYQIEAFMEIFPESAVIILEPDLPLFIEAMRHRDLSTILSSPLVRFLLGIEPETVTQYLPENPTGELHVFKLRSVYLKDREYYRKADERIGQYSARREINRNTLRRFGTLWVKNLVMNLPTFGASEAVSSLVGIFTGTPAVVCAAGPSLDSVLPRLAEFRERCLLIAVDTSLRGLASQGLSADFTVVVDPQYLNTRHIDRSRRSTGILVSESSTHPRVFRLISGKRYFGGSLFPLGIRIEREFGSYGKLGAGGSVATSAWDLARILGCSPIFMAGLDLSFPKNQTHYRGSFFEERAYSENARCHPVETASFQSMNDAGPFRAPNNGGGTSITDRRLILYKWWFESQMRLHPETATRTLSPFGLAIEGMPFASVDEIEKLPPARERIDAALRVVLAAPPRGAMESTVPILRQLTAELRETALKAEKGLRLIDELERSLSEGRNTAASFCEPDLLDRQLLSSDSLSLAGFLIQDLEEPLMTGTGQRPGMGDVLARNRTIYRRIAESARFHLELFQRAAERENPA
jgi:hypothetical protein